MDMKELLCDICNQTPERNIFNVKLLTGCLTCHKMFCAICSEKHLKETVYKKENGKNFVGPVCYQCRVTNSLTLHVVCTNS